MTSDHAECQVCSTCGKSKSLEEFAISQTFRAEIVAEIRQTVADWSIGMPVCFECLNRFRAEHVRHLLEEEKGELSSLEQEVIESLREQESISLNVNEEFQQKLTLGQRLADRIAAFGGSWTFLIAFGLMLMVWIVGNSAVVDRKAWDPFPFILLNLILSCLAACQAPIIMMSQNRQEAKDRLRSEHDYRVDLKAELEVRLLHTKVDQLLTHQWQRLLAIQELQTELIADIANRQTSADQRARPV